MPAILQLAHQMRLESAGVGVEQVADEGQWRARRRPPLDRRDEVASPLALRLEEARAPEMEQRALATNAEVQQPPDVVKHRGDGRRAVGGTPLSSDKRR